ncbi:ribosomal protein S18-alanine N-acetyltransferase [Marinobacter fuscus]|nr:ribosomal protein S18-alanine N-acetyltransferase [Marinobacter fuscus]
MTARPLEARVASLHCMVRPMVSGDVPAVMELERLGHSHPWSEAVFEDCFKANYRCRVLEIEGAIQGYTVVSYLADEAHLMNICVHPGQRGQGVGAFLLNAVVREARREACTQMILEVRASNEAAARLYLRSGFDEIGRRKGYYPGVSGREDALVMALRFT